MKTSFLKLKWFLMMANSGLWKAFVIRGMVSAGLKTKTLMQCGEYTAQKNGVLE